MTFQQKAYAAFWIAMTIVAVATLITVLNDREVSELAYWLFFISIPMLIVGPPALLNQHVFGKEEHPAGENQDCKPVPQPDDQPENRE